MPVLPEIKIAEELMTVPWVRERIAQDSAFNVYSLGVEIGELAEMINRLRWQTDRSHADALNLLADVRTAAVLLIAVADHAAATVATMRDYKSARRPATAKPKKKEKARATA